MSTDQIKVCIRLTVEQKEWLVSKSKPPFYTMSDVMRDLIDFTRGPKEDTVDLAREQLRQEGIC